MLPTLQSGWVVLVNRRAYKSRPPEAGDIVLAEFPGTDNQPVIKRVHRSGPEGFDLRGDNPAKSDDSVTKGLVPPERILGQVICTFPKFSFEPSLGSDRIRRRARRAFSVVQAGPPTLGMDPKTRRFHIRAPGCSFRIRTQSTAERTFFWPAVD